MAAGLFFAAASAIAAANDFPTQARVEFVVGCMNQRGGVNYDNMYHCSCAVDRIAERLSYADFAEAETFAMLKRTPGERGGVFRDPPRAEELVTALEDAESAAEKSCFVN
jgi:hypothetical protein